MTLRKVIKRNAKAALRGNYGRAILIMLIMALVVMLLAVFSMGLAALIGPAPTVSIAYFEDAINEPLPLPADLNTSGLLPMLAYIGVMMLVELIVLVPLMLGVLNWYLETTDGKRCGVGEIFWPFGCRAFGRSIWMEINVVFRMWLFSLLMLCLPTVALTIGVFYLQENVSLNAAAALVVFTSVLFMVLSLLVTVFSLRYSMARILLCRRYEMKVGKAIKTSVRYTKGRRWQLLGMMLSFIPWFLLCWLIIPVFFVVPYYTMSMVMYLRYLYEDGLHREGQLDTSRLDRIIIDDISPEKIAFTAPVPPAGSPQAPNEEFYYPPQAWGAHKEARQSPEPQPIPAEAPERPEPSESADAVLTAELQAVEALEALGAAEPAGQPPEQPPEESAAEAAPSGEEPLPPPAADGAEEKYEEKDEYAEL